MRYQELFEDQKIIAYHGTGVRIEQFFDPFLAGHFFTTDKEYAKMYMGKTGISRLNLIDKAKKGRNYIIKVELDIKHMFDTKTDQTALDYYNTEFVPAINTIQAKYKAISKPPVPLLEPGHYVPFIYADELFRHFMRYKPDYDGMLVDEGSWSSEPAIVAFFGSQIKILKREIVK